ncbi:MAG: pyridoxal 5'-phosphate synthase glutaminase subunit PdxT [Anaerolineales bacterium]|nr:pyridoxal 5'-phosphate synthase glutaminase subunit PdxT [Anaerolineae bacterium]PWB56430.1 MAG: pyridoxal 5'-phosphate synthase glutaminase subunit PdxT [Anaerolineales bacterium]
MRIGILALQGDFAEHSSVLRRLGMEAEQVRLPSQLDGLDRLIIPGGESTTFAKLAVSYGMMEPLRQFGEARPVWGTCAGAIFLSKDAHRNQPLLQLMDITVERNAFGRQVNSFEVDLDVPALLKVDPLERPFHAVFIRAPLIESVQADACILSKLDDGRIVAAQQGHLLATAFHPELTNDDRFHRYFLQMAA